MAEKIKKFVDDKIELISEDVKKIQKKPSMYISSIGSKGVTQLFKEMVNNSIDESINPNSPCNTINIVIDLEENSISVSDNGRGIPPDDMVIACTKIQAGSKFTREQSGTSAGENGLGLTAINALSDNFTMITERYGKKYILNCSHGKPDGEILEEKTKSSSNGLSVKIIPSDIFLGKATIDIEEITDWLDKISYLIPEKVTIFFTVNGNKKNSIPKKTYRNTDGMRAYIKSKGISFETGVTHLEKSTTVQEEIKETITSQKGKLSVESRMVDREINVEFSFSYSSKFNEFTSDSFCNYINTIDGGTHVDAVKQAFTSYISKELKKYISERELEKLEINSNDIQKGLFLVLNLKTDLQPQFSGQTKQKITSSELARPIRTIVTEALIKYFATEQNELKKIIAFVKLNAKTRVEANKIRNSVVKGEINNLAEHSIDKFVPANNRGKNEYRELILIEGDSASGSARLGRFDPDSQAVFALRGVPKNTFGQSLDKVLGNQRFNDLVRVLKTNIGEKFDIKKLHYDKIIIMADADIDGHHITALLCTFFLMHMPELVKEGRIYKAVSPLYKLREKDNKFALNKKDYVDIFERKIRNSIVLISGKTKKRLTTDEIKEFLDVNRTYLEEMEPISKHFGVSPIVLEKIILLKILHKNKWREEFNKIFPEIHIDEEGVLSGIYENAHCICTIDEEFDEMIDPVVDIMNRNPSYLYEFREINSSGKEEKFGVVDIGFIMRRCEKYQPYIMNRFKGLAELNPEQLKETTMDPNTRILIRLSVSDMNEAINKFSVILGTDSDSRKSMMKSFRINKEDIDN